MRVTKTAREDVWRNRCISALHKAMIRAHHTIGTMDWIALVDSNWDVESGAQRITEHPRYLINLVLQNGTPDPLLVSTNTLIHACAFELPARSVLVCPTRVTSGYYDAYRFHSPQQSKHDAERNVEQLRQWIALNTDAERAIFHLARALEDAGDLRAAHTTYMWHNRMQRHSNYVYYALYRMACITAQLTSRARAQRAFERAVDFSIADSRGRREPYLWLARLAQAGGQWGQCVFYASTGLGAPGVDWSRRPLNVADGGAIASRLRNVRDACAERL